MNTYLIYNILYQQLENTEKKVHINHKIGLVPNLRQVKNTLK